MYPQISVHKYGSDLDRMLDALKEETLAGVGAFKSFQEE